MTMNHKTCRAGMSYVELIVVLGIFSAVSSVVIFNYGAFQSKVDIKNLGSDIALQIVEAQNAALSGNLSRTPTVSPWKPAYGLYFSTTPNNNADDRNFIHFVDLNNDAYYNDTSCSPSNGECLEKITIAAKESSISRIDGFVGSSSIEIKDPFAISFKRPDSKAFFSRLNSSPPPDIVSMNFDYIQITVVSPQGNASKIRVYGSGRIEVK